MVTFSCSSADARRLIGGSGYEGRCGREGIPPFEATQGWVPQQMDSVVHRQPREGLVQTLGMCRRVCREERGQPAEEAARSGGSASRSGGVEPRFGWNRAREASDFPLMTFDSSSLHRPPVLPIIIALLRSANMNEPVRPPSYTGAMCHASSGQGRMNFAESACRHVMELWRIRQRQAVQIANGGRRSATWGKDRRRHPFNGLGDQASYPVRTCRQTR
jgi:hypothetical protein